MSWDDAKDWAEQLVFSGYDDWRLPEANPVNGTSYNYSPTYDGSSDLGWNITSPNSEMSYMYYVELGNLGYYNTNGDGPQMGYGLVNTGPFINLESFYWTGSAFYDPPSKDIAFNFYFTGDDSAGCQSGGWLMEELGWAVREMKPVPEPATMLLLGSGLIGLAGFRRKIRRKRQ